MKLSLQPVNGGPFYCLPAREVDLPDDRILCNDVTFPWEFNPHNVHLFVVGNEFGPMGAVWAFCDQDALDALVDASLAGSVLIDEADADDDSPRLGNASEPANLDNVWIQTVRLDPALDARLLCAFAEARGANNDTLDR